MLAAALLLLSIFKTPVELWSGYDPRALPLEAKIAQEWPGDGIVVRKVWYTSEIASGFKVRIVGYYAFPSAAGKVPALLHIHGGGQTATREYVEYWAKRGYATLSINWGGYPLERTSANGNTDWGPLHADQRDLSNTYKVSPDTRANSWYHWAIACRRGLTFLEQQPEVDGTRLGIFGVSMGGRLTWLIAGIDSRVKAAISIFGAVAMTDPLPGLPGSEQLHLAPEDAAIWRSALDAQAYAPDIRCPFFFLSAADDFYGSMDQVTETLAMIPHSNRWQSFTPHYNHHVEPEQSAAMPMWMDHWLKDGPAWPASPRIRIEPKRVPLGEVQPDRAAEVRKVSIYYSTDPYPQSRFWRTAEVAHTGSRWRAKLPLTVTDRGLYAYANVLYESGLSLSTPLVHAPADKRMRATDPPVLLIDDFQQGMRNWFVPLSSPNPIIGDRQDPDWRMATRRVGDPKWKGPPGAALAIKVRSAQPNTMLVLATENEFRRGRETRLYIAKVPLQGGDWQTVRVPLTSFHAVDGGAALASWAEVNLLSLQSQYLSAEARRAGRTKDTIGAPWRGARPEFARVEWERPPS